MNVLPLLALALTGMAPQDAPSAPPANEEAMIRSVVGERVPGTPVPCVQTRSLGSSVVIPGVGVIYQTAGTRMYLNRPRAGLNQLTPDTIAVSQSSGSRLCENDQVEIQNRFDRAPIGILQLGEFVPYNRARAAK